MKNFLATAATALCLSAPAFAAGHAMTFAETTFEQGSDFYASNLIGMRVYSAENDPTVVNAQTVAEWDDIGEINDLIVSKDGQIDAVILGVGGFIGIGEKDVAVSMSDLRVLRDEDGERFLVVTTSAEALEAAPTFERAEMDMKAETHNDTMSTTMNTDTAMDRPMLTPPMVEREGYTVARLDELTTEDVTGARLYGASDEDIGEVNSLILSDDGKLTDAILDIGGFLGMGEHQVKVSMEELQILRSSDSGDVRVYIESSKEALKAQPEYEG